MISLNDRNGVIDKYQVLIRQKDVDTTWTTYFVTENDATKTIDIEGLEKWRDYEYVVSGCTIGGCGENSTIAVQRTDEDSKFQIFFLLSISHFSSFLLTPLRFFKLIEV